MADQDQGSKVSSGAVKLIIVSTLAIIALLITIKQLNFNPSEVVTGSVSVKFQGITPPAGQAPPAQNTTELEKKVAELQTRLQQTGAPEKEPPAAVSTSSAPSQSAPVRPGAVPNIAGQWRSQNYFSMLFTQYGNQVAVQVYLFGVLTSAGQGTITGNSLQVDYQNYANVPGRMSGTISADGTRMDLTDYGSVPPTPLTLMR